MGNERHVYSIFLAFVKKTVPIVRLSIPYECRPDVRNTTCKHTWMKNKKSSHTTTTSAENKNIEFFIRRLHASIRGKILRDTADMTHRGPATELICFPIRFAPIFTRRLCKWIFYKQIVVRCATVRSLVSAFNGEWKHFPHAAHRSAP